MLAHGYLRLDPALGVALSNELTGDGKERARAAWVRAMAGLAGFLSGQRLSEPVFAQNLTLLELANFLANLGRPRALALAAKIRAGAAERLGWGRARFEAERAGVERLLDEGRLHEAVAAARALLAMAEAAGAYEESIKEAEDLKHPRQVAVGKFQLATVRMRQERYAEALAGFGETLVLLCYKLNILW
ncbi:MAG: hypothetical protein AAB225_10895 [Acidobacteriota bacterium]